jgi:hypothetical protein
MCGGSGARAAFNLPEQIWRDPIGETKSAKANQRDLIGQSQWSRADRQQTSVWQREVLALAAYHHCRGLENQANPRSRRL